MFIFRLQIKALCVYSGSSALLPRLVTQRAHKRDRARCRTEKNEDEEVTVFPEELLALVFQERQGKQETKRVLSELQSNYDELLRKFAAA